MSTDGSLRRLPAAARRWRTMRGTCAGLALAALVPVAALAQEALERNLPAMPSSAASVTVGSDEIGSTDSTPLGVDLTGIALIGAGPTRVPAAAGITINAIDGAPEPALRAALAPYLSQPLSLALVSQIQAEVTRVWRRAGYPFVSVTIPPQEVTSGVLGLRVVEFRAGTKTVRGVDGPAAERIARSVRVEPGERIDGPRLNEDLRWLGRTGYRTVSAVFAPGGSFGTSDLTLDVTTARTPQVYAGWNNGGSRVGGRNRYYAGFSAWIPGLNDAAIGYQITGSADLWSQPTRILPSAGNYPVYLSHAAQLVLPTFSRQALEFSPNFVVSRQDSGALLSIENTTLELPVLYRSALSNLVPGLHAGDIYGGLELKFLKRATFFNGVQVASGQASVLQIVAGWAHGFDDPLGRTQIDIAVRANPGGVLSGSTDANWSSFSNGRVTSASYVYATADLAHYTELPARFAWTSQISARAAGQALPDSERMALGGFSAVRAYDIDDATVDTGVVWRNELRLPSISNVAQGASGMSDRLSPYLFADLGYGRDFSAAGSTLLGSVGVGADYSIGDNLNASVIAGRALTSAAYTSAGDLRVQFNISAGF